MSGTDVRQTVVQFITLVCITHNHICIIQPSCALLIYCNYYFVMLCWA